MFRCDKRYAPVGDMVLVVFVLAEQADERCFPNNPMPKDLVPSERIQQSIYLIRAQKVMPDRGLAPLYGIPTKALKQAVRRNLERFPDDFMFVLSASEFCAWRSQL